MRKQKKEVMCSFPTKVYRKGDVRYSLVGDDFKNQVVQQSELLCNLQCRVVLEGVSFPPHLPDTEEHNNNCFIILKTVLTVMYLFHLDDRC